MQAFSGVPAVRAALFRAGAMCRTTSSARPGISLHRAPGRLRMMSAAPNPPNTVMGTIEKKLSDALTPERLVVTPTYGDPQGAHVSIEVVSSAFEGMAVVKRHRAVYKVIWEELSGPIHAVDELVTKTPSEDQ